MEHPEDFSLKRAKVGLSSLEFARELLKNVTENAGKKNLQNTSHCVVMLWVNGSNSSSPYLFENLDFHLPAEQWLTQ